MTPSLNAPPTGESSASAGRVRPPPGSPRRAVLNCRLPDVHRPAIDRSPRRPRRVPARPARGAGAGAGRPARRPRPSHARACAARRWRCSPACRSRGTRGSSRAGGSTPRPTCCGRSAGRCDSTMPGIDHLTALGQPARGAAERRRRVRPRRRAVGVAPPDRRLRAGARLRARTALGVRRVERRPGAVVPAHRVAAPTTTATCCGCCSPIRRPAN